MPSKIQFSKSHCGTFYLQFFFFCYLNEIINLADSLDTKIHILYLHGVSITVFMMLFWAVAFYSYFCHSFYTPVNHFWFTDPFLWTEENS